MMLGIVGKIATNLLDSDSSNTDEELELNFAQNKKRARNRNYVEGGGFPLFLPPLIIGTTAGPLADIRKEVVLQVIKKQFSHRRHGFAGMSKGRPPGKNKEYGNDGGLNKVEMPDFSFLLTLLLSLIGAIVVFFFLLDISISLLKFLRAVLAPLFLANEETSLAKKYGEWALITGSTDGIGRAYAKELAKRGINIVLVSRSLDKLSATQKEIESQYDVKTKIIQADFSLGKKAVDLVIQELGKLPIGILVNNVGKQYEYPMYVGEVPEKDLHDIINVNVVAVTLMCRAFINDMKNNRRGAIVNVSSGSELQPLPLMTVYAATKTYIKNFTLALRYEYSKYNIFVQHLAPMFVATKMNHFSDKIYQKSLFVPDTEAYAQYAVSTLGKLDDTSGYWAHGIQTFFTKLPPEWVRIYIGCHMNKMFREDYLKTIKGKQG